MGTGQEHITGHRILVHADHAAGAQRPTALADVVQDVENLRVGQAGLLQDGPLALGEVGLANATIDQTDSLAFSTPAPEGEISLAPAALLGAVGILATELFDGIHGGSSQGISLELDSSWVKP